MAIHFKSFIGAIITHDEQPRVDYTRTQCTSSSFGLYRRTGKRVLDVLFVVASAPIALALIGAAALLTLLVDGHMPFYWQKRVGRNGRVFWLLKIRTMVPEADAKLETYLKDHPGARQEWDEKQKLDGDPRITRLGAFFRKSSLDELPQLWNVLKGDMSLVGPRPMMVEQQRLYPGRAYFNLVPGITGNWQISDRNESSFAARAGFDDAYEASLSLKTDLNILVRTVGVVLLCTGR